MTPIQQLIERLTQCEHIQGARAPSTAPKWFTMHRVNFACGAPACLFGHAKELFARDAPFYKLINVPSPVAEILFDPESRDPHDIPHLTNVSISVAEAIDALRMVERGEVEFNEIWYMAIARAKAQSNNRSPIR